MTYKILLVRNRFTEKIKIQKGLDWFSTNTPITIVTEELVTDFDVTTEKISNQKYSGVICGDDIYPKLRSVIPEGKYHAVVFMYGNDLAGIRVNVSKQLPLYPGTDLIQLCDTKDNGKSLNHEIFHTFFHRLQRQQVPVEDPMDFVVVDGIGRHYWNNGDLDAKPSNRSIALDRLKSYWNKVAHILILSATSPVVNTSLPIVTIVRKATKKQTTGILVAGNSGASFACKTVERPWLNNANNISCIPTGTYQVKWTLSPKFMKYTYQVMNVPNRSGIRIHSANYYSQLQGCIALGDALVDINKDGELDTINSKKTIALFENFMQKKPFTLVVK